MGYTHYWYRRGRRIAAKKFDAIRGEFEKLLPEFEGFGIRLAGGRGTGNPELSKGLVCFNGAQDCGHRENSEICIPWPSEKASGVAQGRDGNEASGSWFGGAEIDRRMCNGDCSYETFHFPLVLKKESYDSCKDPWIFDFCKTAYRPYDLAVNCFLIIAKHHLGEGFLVKSDGEAQHWADGRALCHKILGYGLDFELDRGEEPYAE